MYGCIFWKTYVNFFVKVNPIVVLSMNLQQNNKVLLIQSANKAVYQQQRSRLKNINTYMLRKTS